MVDPKGSLMEVLDGSVKNIEKPALDSALLNPHIRFVPNFLAVKFHSSSALALVIANRMERQ